MAPGRGQTAVDDPRLDIELLGDVSGSQVRMTGDVVAQTSTALWGIEPILMNEARVTFDLSAVTSIDGAGLEAVLSLMDSVRSFGGSLVIGCERCAVRPAAQVGAVRPAAQVG